jgi:hypothetical protein
MPERLGLVPPPEPVAIKEALAERARKDPAGTRRRLAEGTDLADTLWSAWGSQLETAGAESDALAAHLGSCRREVWLWIMGERTWDELARLVSGGVLRRVLVSSGR